MTDYHPDGTIVYCIICIGVEERRLQDTCREANLVGCRHVVGIYILRIHEPTLTIYGFAELAHIEVLLKTSYLFEVFVETLIGTNSEL